MTDYMISNGNKKEILEHLSITIDQFNSEIKKLGNCIQTAEIELYILSELGALPHYKIEKVIKGVDTKSIKDN